VPVKKDSAGRPSLAGSYTLYCPVESETGRPHPKHGRDPVAYYVHGANGALVAQVDVSGLCIGLHGEDCAPAA